MFCEESPCSCNTTAKPKPKKKAAAKKPPKKQVDKPESKPESKPKVQPKVEAKPEVEWPAQRKRRGIVKDLATHRAIQAFAGADMLDRKELAKHQDKIKPPVTGQLQEYIEGGDYEDDEVQ